MLGNPDGSKPALAVAGDFLVRTRKAGGRRLIFLLYWWFVAQRMKTRKQRAVYLISRLSLENTRNAGTSLGRKIAGEVASRFFSIIFFKS